MDSRILSAEHAEQSGVDQALGGGQRGVVGLVPVARRRRRRATELVGVAPPASRPGDCRRSRSCATELPTPYALSDAQAERSAPQGYLKVPDVLSPGALALARGEVERLPAGTAGTVRLPFAGHDVAGRLGGAARVRPVDTPRPSGRRPAGRRRRPDLSRQRAHQDARLRAHAMALRRPPLPHRVARHRHELDSAAGGPGRRWDRSRSPRGSTTWRLAEGVDFNARDRPMTRVWPPPS